MEKEKSRRPEDTPFKQQKLKAWQPILTPNWVIGTFAMVGLVFIPIGVILHLESENVVEMTSVYDGPNMTDTDCSLPDVESGNAFNLETHSCVLNFKIDQDMIAPIYVYYQLDNFYQNHRRYVQSRSDAQLRGDADASTSDCEPMRTTKEPVNKYNSIETEPVETNTVFDLNPCGLIANSLFNDLIWVNQLTLPNEKILARDTLVPDSWDGVTPNQAVDVKNLMNQEGIAWKSDLDTKFKNIPEGDRNDKELYLWENQKYRNVIPREVGQLPVENVTAWTRPTTSFGVQDEHFIIWMRTAGLPNFRKVYGIINTDLPKGSSLQFLIGSNFVVQSFDGSKALVISTTSWFGGKNPFLGIAYITVGCLCMVLAILFFAKHKLSPRKLGDTRYLVWKNNQ